MVERITLKVQGRLGNQLFQYAFARAMQLKWGGHLIIDFSLLGMSKKKNCNDGGFIDYLSHFNTVDYTYIDIDNKNEVRHETLLQKYIQKIVYRYKFNNPILAYIMDRVDFPILSLFGMFYMETYNMSKYIIPPYRRKILIKGYYESLKYFKEYDDTICKELRLKIKLSDKYQRLYNLFANSNSICVTIRRGYFLQDDRFNICTKQYFENGIKYILQKHPDSIMYMCSDDIEWCKKNFENFDIPIYYQSSELKTWENLHLMSSCHHFVISNSTYSWWAQHLSKHSDKIVVAPKIWRNEFFAVKDIFEDTWTLM